MLAYLARKEVSIAILLSISMVTVIFPYGFPLFGVLVAAFSFLHFITNKVKFRFSIGFFLFYLCVLFYFLGLLQNEGTMYNRNKSEIINMVSFLLVWIMLSDLTRDKYKTVVDIFAKITANICFVTAAFSLVKFYALLNGTNFAFLYSDTDYPLGTSLVKDYNMFAYGIFAGLLMTVYLMNKSKTTFAITYYSLGLLFCTLSILFSGSRRGWVVAAIVAIFLLVKLFFFLVNFVKNHKRIVRVGMVFSYVTVMVILCFKLFGIEINVANSTEFEKIQYRFETMQSNNIDSSFSERTIRWEYSFDMIREMNVLQLAFGNGFGYLTDFANRFNPQITEDYPHNPIISAFLYSGLFGTVALLFLLGWSIYQTLSNRHILGSYFVLIYLISWPFILISTNTIFSVKMFLMLLVVVSSIPSRSINVRREGILKEAS